MAIKQTPNSQWGWVTSAEKSSFRAFVEFVGAVESSEAELQFSDIQVTLAGHIDAVQLQGPYAQIVDEYEQLGSKEFTSLTLVGSLASNPNIKLSLSMGVPQRTVTATLQHGSAELAARYQEIFRGIFPKTQGLTAAEIESDSRRIEKLLGDLETIRAQRDRVAELVSEIETQREKTSELSAQIEAFNSTSQSSATELAETKAKDAQLSEEIAALHAEAKTLRDDVKAFRDSTQESQANASALEADIKKFHADIETYKHAMNEFQARAGARVKQYEDRAEEVVSEHERLEEQIREQLLRAVGGRLFGAFEERKGAILVSKWVWAIASAVSMLIQGGAVVWLANEAGKIAADSGAFYTQPMFILKATVTLPIFALIVFCIRQYAREREFEELYAFKSAVSFSLAPYMELVEGISDRENSEQYSSFVIESIGKIFERPAGNVHSGAPKGFKAKDIQQLIASLNELLKTARP